MVEQQGGRVTEAPATGVQINASFFPHALFLFSPKVKIDDQIYSPGWGSHFFPLAPGPHTVALGFMYCLMPERFHHSINVHLDAGKVQKVTFRMLPWTTGSLQAN